jgi:hypothetical protein
LRLVGNPQGVKFSGGWYEATGFVSGEHPDFYFKFDAKADQKIIIHTEGGGLKTGPGIPIARRRGASRSSMTSRLRRPACE